MSARGDIVMLLRDPAAFAATLPAADADRWRAGLAFALRHVGEHGRSLRPAQIAAWEGSAARRVALVLGPPGTGKTFLLAWMAAGHLHARLQAKLPCRVLLTGFTRESIGNLVEALEEVVGRHVPGVSLLFVGRALGQPLPAAVEYRSTGPRVLPTLRDELVGSPLVIGATTWAVAKMCEGWDAPGSDGLAVPLFDLVLIDEASQMMLAQGLLSLAGLAENGRILVAGDDRQLPPIRPTSDAVESTGRLLGGSLYSFLKSAGVSEFRLEETYRLNAPLADPVAELFYDGKYRSAVPDRRLALRAGWADGLSDWERAALDPEYPLCVLLHDGPPCGTENPFERQILIRLTQVLSARLPPGNLWQDQLALICPHRAQNALLSQALPDDAAIETVDRIQGRERDAILAGYTVSDAEFAAVEAPFLFSPQRLNVTVTRARSKLVLLLSRRLLDVLPADEDVFDAAQQFREYVLGCDALGPVTFATAEGASIGGEIRVRRFATPPPAQPTEDTTVTAAGTSAMTPSQSRLLDAIRQIAAAKPQYNQAFDSQIRQRLEATPSWEDFVALLTRGLVIRRHLPSCTPPWGVASDDRANILAPLRRHDGAGEP